MLRLQVGLLSFFLCQVVNIDINMDVYICCFSHFFFSYNIYGIFPWEYPFNITLNMPAEQNDFLWNVLLSFWWFVNDIEEEVLNENDLGGGIVLFCLGVFFFHHLAVWLLIVYYYFLYWGSPQKWYWRWSTIWKVGYSLYLYVKESLGKMLNPELPPLGVWPCECHIKSA